MKPLTKKQAQALLFDPILAAFYDAVHFWDSHRNDGNMSVSRWNKFQEAGACGIDAVISYLVGKPEEAIISARKATQIEKRAAPKNIIGKPHPRMWRQFENQLARKLDS